MERKTIKKNLLDLEKELGFPLSAKGLGEIANNEYLVGMIEESQKTKRYAF